MRPLVGPGLAPMLPSALPRAQGWNVWRGAHESAVCVGWAATRADAHALAQRLGADQIQQGVDGVVWGVQRP